MPRTLELERIADGEVDRVPVTEAAVDIAGTIYAFTANGKHYHLKKHRHEFHAFAAATAAARGASLGNSAGRAKGPTGALTGAVVGSVVFFLGELTNEHVQEQRRHGGQITWCYVNDAGREIYWGPAKGDWQDTLGIPPAFRQ